MEFENNQQIWSVHLVLIKQKAASTRTESQTLYTLHSSTSICLITVQIITIKTK